VPRRGQVLGLQPPDPLLLDLQFVPAFRGATEQRHDEGDAGGAHGGDLLGGEVLVRQHRGRCDRLPDFGGGPVAGGDRVHDEGQPVPGQLGGQVAQQRSDRRAHRPVRQQAEHHVGATAAKCPGGGGRGVPEPGGGVQDALAGLLRDLLVRRVVQYVADGGAGKSGFACYVRTRHPACLCLSHESADLPHSSLAITQRS
jgi:hypothetical protein